MRILLFASLVACQLLLTAGASGSDNPRLVVLTDIGGDPDDQQSMIRLLLYANEFEIEGLIATASGTPGELKQVVVRPDLIREIVNAYGRVRENLSLHARDYPLADYLLARIKSGNANRGLEAIGEGHDTEGSRWIIECADRKDERRLNITIWGGQTDFAQALWRVRKDRGAEGLKKFLARLRVYDIDDQDAIQPWIFENFPDLFYVLAKSARGADKRTGAYRGMYLGGDESLTSREWINTHIRSNHGPLGALYPDNTWTAPNPHSALKEGDTPSWFYFLPNGLSDPARPEFGGWGGRFRKERAGLWRGAKDTVGGTTDTRTTVWRWRPAFQADFQTRMDWCGKRFEEANHAPVALLNETDGRGVVNRTAKTGESVKLSAAGSTDPDGNRLAYKWYVYPEAGTYGRAVSIERDKSQLASLEIPRDAAGKSLHVILEVSDDGKPALTRYRRAVIQVSD